VRIVLAGLLATLLGASLIAQSPTGSIGGIVFDADARAVSGAEIIVVNDLTRVQYQTKTNDFGMYVVPNLAPGPYRIQASKVGFKTLIKPDIILNVQDAITVNFTLPVGATSIAVTVEGGAPMLNTSDASVSTVVDREFVANIPLSGRSFQSLVLLTPGLVTNSPQNTGSVGTAGEFSVNGQRTESNYYTVDGVSANVGISNAISYPGASGSLPSATALGTTQALVSVDALQEFRVTSSTYSAEYGRSPGGQFSLVTRSGTNEYHGTAFDYLRNGAFDANDWFTNYYGQSQAALRQNDFGGTLGGPASIPGLYHGKDRTFFFVSYEGLRLIQPQPAAVSYVPSLSLRQQAPAPLQSVLNAFPAPHCQTLGTGCSEDLGNGLGEFVGTWSNPSRIDSTSVRIDEVLRTNMKLFFRFADTPSQSDVRAGAPYSPTNVQSSSFHTATFTAGATMAFSDRLANEFRLNYSSNKTVFDTSLAALGGSAVPNLAQLQGLAVPPGTPYNIQFLFGFDGTYAAIGQDRAIGEQRQWNIVDTMSALIGRHSLRFGVDFRRLTPYSKPFDPSFTYYFLSESSAAGNDVDFGSGAHSASAYPDYRNFSAFIDDQWHVTRRLSLSIGLRWEVNPAPGATQGLIPYTVNGLNNLSTMTLGPQGTPLWKTDWFNFAPRFGAAYTAAHRGSYELVLRGGFGVFFDTGQQVGSFGYDGVGFASRTSFGSLLGSPTNFPAPVSILTPIVNPPTAPYTDSAVYAYPTHLQLPYTLEWNTSVEQAFGASQVFTVSYIGSAGRRLLAQSSLDVSAINPNFVTIDLFRNGLTSEYQALQLQYRRRLVRGLSALVSYTFAHSIDYGSNDAALPYVRGNSDFDVRHSAGGAISYDLPGRYENRIASFGLGNWGLDGRFVARTGFPVTLAGNLEIDPVTQQYYNAGLDLVPGQQLYLNGSECTAVYGFSCPGGRAINPNAFALPTAGQAGNAPRNFVRGFGAWQTDFAVRKEFPLHDRLKLQFRAEGFNVFNHPSFGTINSTYCPPGAGCTFGQATASLSQSLGVLSPLYQMGGPRSLQFALRLMF
jgi:carboxypeptidase family protein